jgi:hypothetical protein
MKEIEKIMNERSEIRNSISKLKDDLSSINSDLISRCDPIIQVMQKSERDVIDMDEFKDFKYIGKLDLDPVRGLWHLNGVKIKKGCVKINSGKSYCGGYDNWIIKIPLSYFDISLEEVSKIHKEWSLSLVRKRIKKYRDKEIENKRLRIEKLKRELDGYKD